jgi:hypothetical protein
MHLQDSTFLCATECEDKDGVSKVYVAYTTGDEVGKQYSDRMRTVLKHLIFQRLVGSLSSWDNVDGPMKEIETIYIELYGTR